MSDAGHLFPRYRDFLAFLATQDGDVRVEDLPERLRGMTSANFDEMRRAGWIVDSMILGDHWVAITASGRERLAAADGSSEASPNAAVSGSVAAAQADAQPGEVAITLDPVVVEAVVPEPRIVRGEARLTVSSRIEATGTVIPWWASIPEPLPTVDKSAAHRLREIAAELKALRDEEIARREGVAAAITIALEGVDTAIAAIETDPGGETATPATKTGLAASRGILRSAWSALRVMANVNSVVTLIQRALDVIEPLLHLG